MSDNEDATLAQRIANRPFPKVTEDYMRSRIKTENFLLQQPLTICIITLDNGYTVTGESACADPRNYDQSIGESLARKHAFSKLWPLFGFLLSEEIYAQSLHNGDF